MAGPTAPLGSDAHSRAQRPRNGELRRQLRWAAGALSLTLREPADGLDRVRVRAREFVRGQPSPTAYAVDADWHRRLHDQLGQPWPCDRAAEFEALWTRVLEDAHAHGVSLGRSTYGGWDDGDRAFAQAIWCLIGALKPGKVVETGVAHGVTTRVILEALERLGSGRLWSIDLPALDSGLRGSIAIAVPDSLRERWTYISGTSRRRLPGLLSTIGPIDLFVHDSSHTERNMLFELQRAWPAIARGAIVADDVQQSPAFARFSQSLAAAQARAYVAPAEDGKALFGIALKDVERPTH
jgi:hypothetical protein